MLPSITAQNRGSLPAKEGSQIYFLAIGVMGGAFRFVECYDWNAVYIIEQRFNLDLRSGPAGCIPTESLLRSYEEAQRHNDGVNESLREAGLLAVDETIDQLLEVAFQRQRELDRFVRRQKFFKVRAAAGVGPVLIKSEPTDDIAQFVVRFFQKDRKGQLNRVYQARVNMATLTISLLNTPSEPATYPWCCGGLVQQ